MNLRSLAPYAYCLFQFGLLLYAISPVVYAIGWLYIVLTLLFLTCFAIGTTILFMTYKRDKFEAFRLFMGTPKDRIYDAMISVAGLILCNVMGAYSSSLLWGFILLSAIWGFFFPNPMNRR